MNKNRQKWAKNKQKIEIKALFYERGINNMKIDHIEAHTNGNEIVEGKESVHCSCSIF